MNHVCLIPGPAFMLKLVCAHKFTYDEIGSCVESTYYTKDHAPYVIHMRKGLSGYMSFNEMMNCYGAVTNPQDQIWQVVNTCKLRRFLRTNGLKDM